MVRKRASVDCQQRSGFWDLFLGRHRDIYDRGHAVTYVLAASRHPSASASILAPLTERARKVLKSLTAKGRRNLATKESVSYERDSLYELSCPDADDRGDRTDDREEKP